MTARLVTLKNALVYKAELPPRDALEQHLQELVFAPISAHEARRISVVPGTTGDLAVAFPGGVAITFRIEEKVMPRAAIDREIANQTEAAEKLRGRPLSKGEKQVVREEAYELLLAHALVTTKHVTVFHHNETQLLIMPITSRNVATMLMHRLIQACGSVRTTTIHVSEAKGGLTARLKRRIAEDEAQAFDGFEVGEYAQLGRLAERETYRRDDLTAASSGIADSLANGFQVKQLELSRDNVTFRLGDDFTLRGLDFGEMPELEPEEADDEAHTWCAAAAWKVSELVGVINALCELFGYAMPDFPEPEPDAGAEQEKAA